MESLHKEIKVSFLPVRLLNFHLIGVLDCLSNSTKKNIGFLDDIVQAVNASATPNVEQLVWSQSGESIVPTFNWSDYFNEHTAKSALKAIKKMQHFHFSHRFPGQVKVRSESDGTERTIYLCKEPPWLPAATELPAHIVPPGLSLERQWYL